MGEVVTHPFEVVGSGPLVALGPVDRSETVGDFARIHVGVPNQDQPGLTVVAAEELTELDLLRKRRVAIDPLVNAIVEVDVVELLEVTGLVSSRKQGVHQFFERPHRTANIHCQQQTKPVFSRWFENQLELSTLAGGAIDSVIEIELVGRAGPFEGTQLGESDAELPRVEHTILAVLLVASLRGHLNCGARAVVATDSDPARMSAGVSERRRPAGADPVVASIVAFGLFGQPPFKLGAQSSHIDRIHQLQPFGVDGEWYGRIFEPIPHHLLNGCHFRINTPKVGNKAKIEVIQLSFILDHDAAGERIKAHQRRPVQTPGETFDQGEPLLRCDLETMVPEAIEERKKDPGVIGGRRCFRHRR